MLLNIRGARSEHNIDGLAIDTNATVAELRRVVAERLHITDPASLRLVYSGRLLEDGQPVSYYNIQDGRAVHVVVSAPTTSGSASHTASASATGPVPGPNTFTFRLDNANNGEALGQMGANVGSMLSSVAPLLSGVQQVIQSQQAGATLSTLLSTALQQQQQQQQQVQHAQQAPTAGVPVSLAAGLSGFPSATTTTTTAATAPLAGFPSATTTTTATTSSSASSSASPSAAAPAAPAAAASPASRPTTLPTAAPGPAVSRGIPLARTMPVHVPGTANITMTTTNVTSPAMLAMTPPIAGVYVHVHCDFNELDQLPARLQQLQQRMAMPQVVFQGHGPAAATTPSSQTTATPVTSNNNTTTTVTSTTSTATVDPDALRLRPHPASEAVPMSTRGTHQENVPRWFGALSPDVHVTPLLLPTILSAVGERIGATGVPALLAGNWAPVAQQRRFMASELLAYTDRFCPAGVAFSDICDREAWRLYHHIWSQEPIRRLVVQEQRPEMAAVDPSTGRTPLQSEFLSYLRSLHNRVVELMHTAPGGLSDAAWMVQLRSNLVRMVGVAYHRSAHWFTQGSAALTRLLMASMELLLLQSPNGASAAGGSMAMMMPLMRMSLPALLQSWVNEYERSGVRSACDDDIFFFAYFPEAGNDAAPVVPTASDLLDAAFSELQTEQATAPPQQDTLAALQAAIGEWADAADVPADVVSTLHNITSSP